MRFLRWLIEPPAESQPRALRALRWLFRATVFCVYCFVVGEGSPGYDGGGNAGVRPNSGKPHKPPT
jgi:hypothetical protein